MIHVGGGRGTTIGDYCSIAHRAVVHGADIGDDCLIGIGAVVMDGAKVGRRCVIGAMALVPPAMEVPEGSVVMGVPGKVVTTRDNFAGDTAECADLPPQCARLRRRPARRLARRRIRPMAERHGATAGSRRGCWNLMCVAANRFAASVHAVSTSLAPHHRVTSRRRHDASG